MTDTQKKQRGIDPDPAETNRENLQQQQKEAREGDFRDAETTLNNTSSFENDYAGSQESQIGKEESTTEDRGRVDKS